ncbi:unnamed protein product [Musa acuminata subsp. burmannicoides]
MNLVCSYILVITFVTLIFSFGSEGETAPCAIHAFPALGLPGSYYFPFLRRTLKPSITKLQWWPVAT